MKLATALFAILLPVAVYAAPDGYFDLTPNAVLETGDTWVSKRERFRLYGVQSCLRGTAYTDGQGNRQDCGDASLAMLAAYIKDTKPICAPVAKLNNISYVVCYATVGSQRLDLAQIMVTSGYAFAALNTDGLPYHAPYAIAEQLAQQKKAGLWQFPDVQHPAILLSREANQRARIVEP
ncbi:thermonuclease family protein [Rhizobium sp. FKY42]|uniref:thermonuclease family protein n=1 Tax=Rhizobium sp. FKY42 TaxID=2562310 RepID=UPI0010C089D7|nr:thermonuclease family protein [Rhizobium sp. FKY42]